MKPGVDYIGVGAGLFIINKKGELLLTKRSMSVRNEKGKWETPGGAVVYGFDGSPKHYACPSCINKKELQILQDDKTYTGEFTCPGCNKSFPVNPYDDSPESVGGFSA